MFTLKLNEPINVISGKAATINDDGDARSATVRDMILMLLGSQRTTSPKDSFQIYGCGIDIGNEDNAVLELTEKRWDFLKRIARENKVKTEKGHDPILAPAVHAQVLMALGLNEEDI